LTNRGAGFWREKSFVLGAAFPYYSAAPNKAENTGGPKTDTQFYFGNNFGNSAPILTILSL